MSFSLNRVMIAGNLTRDPELKYLDGGKTVCSFGIALNRKYKTADGQQREEVSFIECTAWGKTGELVSQYLKKGSGAYIEGRLTQETWEKDGKRQSKTKVTADNVQFIGSKRDAAPDDAPPTAKPAVPTDSAGDTDQPPF
jgi:single-strand DNA-binding protein